MLSIIICSVSPLRLLDVKQNIKETIGNEVLYEIIAVDNREKKWPIAKAYNWGAQAAQYPYLFFVHEDIKFHSTGWGTFIEQKLAEPDCGVIGFAGSKVKLNSYSGWFQNNDWNYWYYCQGDSEGRSAYCVRGVYLDKPFEEVVALDGFAMFVRKDVWNENQFDEKNLTGFHCYDLDFSMQIARKYKNYVCCSFVLIEHLSPGNFNNKWYTDTIRLHVNKWNSFLPLKTNDIELTKECIQKDGERAAYQFLFAILRSDCTNADKAKVLKDFWRRPLSWEHLVHCFSCTLKYLRTIRL